MSEAWPEALESEAYEGTGDAAYETEGEAAYEAEGEGEAYEGLGESARSDRRARQRQIMLARQRQAQFRRERTPRGPGLPPRPPVPPRGPGIAATVQSLDLETKVAQDNFRGQLKRANDRTSRANLATIAATAASQIFDSFENELDGHDIVRVGIRGAPLLLLSSAKKRSGFEGFVLDPRVLGAATLAIIVGAGKLRSASRGVHSIKIADPSPVTVGVQGTLLGVPVDRNGRTVEGITLTWQSQDSTKLQILDAAAGTYDPTGAGLVFVTASAEEVTVSIPVRIQPAGG
jgi:hypothetical protein